MLEIYETDNNDSSIQRETVKNLKSSRVSQQMSLASFRSKNLNLTVILTQNSVVVEDLRDRQFWLLHIEIEEQAVDLQERSVRLLFR
jgi:hypothetical protein